MGAEAVRTTSLLSRLLIFFETRSFVLGNRMKRCLRRRNASGRRGGVARKKSGNWPRSANGSGRRSRSRSVRCAKRRSGLSARRGIGCPLEALAGCGAYVVRVQPCARVPQRGGPRGQVRHFPNSTTQFFSCSAERFVMIKLTPWQVLSRPPVPGVIRRKHQRRRVPRKLLDRPRPRWLYPRLEALPGASRNDPDGK